MRGPWATRLRALDSYMVASGGQSTVISRVVSVQHAAHAQTPLMQHDTTVDITQEAGKVLDDKKFLARKPGCAAGMAQRRRMSFGVSEEGWRPVRHGRAPGDKISHAATASSSRRQQSSSATRACPRARRWAARQAVCEEGARRAGSGWRVAAARSVVRVANGMRV